MRLAFTLALVVISPLSASATSIRFEAVDLSDTTPGEDLWQYAYRVDGFTFDAGFGFSIFFDYTSYGAIEAAPAAPNADWDVLTLQPDVNLPDDGLYDALALVDGASTADLFAVRFIWFGPGLPVSQLFSIYEPGFSTIESGTTVPEPTTAAFLTLGLLLTLAERHRLNRRTA